MGAKSLISLIKVLPSWMHNIPQPFLLKSPLKWTCPILNKASAFVRCNPRLGSGEMHSIACFSKQDWSLHSLPLSPVNGSKSGRTVVENFSPNQTKFILQRTDPISRYRFNLRGRTQIGEGEPATGESPLPLNEGKWEHDASVTGVREVCHAKLGIGPHSRVFQNPHTPI